MSAAWAAEKLGYRFRNEALLAEALHHPSLPGANYERLEFLGDRVLGLAVAEWLYTEFPNEKEGDLSRRLVSLVRKEAIAEAAKSVGLGAALTLSPAEGEAGRQNPGNLSNAFEAVLAAIYLDGGYTPARDLILKLWRPLLSQRPVTDAKTQLQEWLQGKGPHLPKYEELKREGPSHAPHFVVKVSLPDGRSAEGEGTNKRAAEQSAAAALLEKVSKNG